MFNTDGQGNITISRGDTGSITIRVGVKGGSVTADDRAVFTIKKADGAVVKEEYHAFDSGAFDIHFSNNDTESMAVGSYSWDLRFVINPVWQDNRIVNGDQVITPEAPKTLTITIVVG